jgi:hypothetical protein
MRKTLLLVLAALALAQGRQTPDGVYLKGTCGPGFVQAEFLAGFDAALKDEFGAQRAGEMVAALRGAGLDARETLALLNGQLTDSQLRRALGVRHERLPFVRKALDAAVAGKDRRLLFGVLLRTMVEKGEDPSSDFCQIGRSRDTMSDEEFDRICRGEVSTSLLKDSFGFKSKEDAQLMQQYVNRARSSPYLLHPMGASLAGRAKARGAYDPEKFPKPRDGMPGYGNEYKEGTAGGLPFEQALPPVPFYGRNLEDYFAAPK